VDALQVVARARAGLSYAVPGASTEQVLEAALDALLERPARREALVKRPRPTATSATTSTKSRPHIPAAIERTVRLRDGDGCRIPLDAGGTCGSTHQVELDHIVPLALGGETSVDNLRCTCSAHNRRAAALALGLPRIESARRARSRRTETAPAG